MALGFGGNGEIKCAGYCFGVKQAFSLSFFSVWVQSMYVYNGRFVFFMKNHMNG